MKAIATKPAPVKGGKPSSKRAAEGPLIPCTITESTEARIITVETVDVAITIPLYAYQLLFTDGDSIKVPSCFATSELDVAIQVKKWSRAQTSREGARIPSREVLAAQMVEMGLEMPVRVRFDKADWSFIITLTERLGISVGEWVLGGVGYSVWLIEHRVQFQGMEGRAER